jgi:hypothetical protein
MKKFEHKDHTAYEIKKKLVFIKNHNNKIQWIARINKKLQLVNWRFIISKFVLIRTPFLYIEKNNGGFSIGTPNNYLWFIS